MMIYLLYLFHNSTDPLELALTDDPDGVRLPKRATWKMRCGRVVTPVNLNAQGPELRRILDACQRDGYLIINARRSLGSQNHDADALPSPSQAAVPPKCTLMRRLPRKIPPMAHSLEIMKMACRGRLQRAGHLPRAGADAASAVAGNAGRERAPAEAAGRDHVQAHRSVVRAAGRQGAMVRRRTEPGEVMTLGNMRANGVRSLAVSCHRCHHEGVVDTTPWPDDVPVPTFGPRMVCTSCGIVGADARPGGADSRRGEASGGQWRN